MTPATPDALLVLDKPEGITSRDAVNHVQRWLGRRARIGHTGTLDPLATGVLVLCLGSATRLTEYIQRMNKTYRSTFLLGSRSDSDDADGTVTPVQEAVAPDEGQLLEAVTRFVGSLSQTPPAFSAAKVTGKRAYDLARKGETVELQPRRVEVYGIDVLRYAYPLLEVEVRCGKGTYIRSLARDLGEELGCGGLVQTLRRTRVGPFTTEGAVTLDLPREEGLRRLLPLEMALADLPRVAVDLDQAKRLRQGQRISLDPLPEASASGEQEVAVLDDQGHLVAIALPDPGEGSLRPCKVLG